MLRCRCKIPLRGTDAGMLHMRQACLLLAGALLAGVQAQTSSTAPAPAGGQTIIVSQPVFQTNITLKPVSPRRSPVARRQEYLLNLVLSGCTQHCGIADIRLCYKGVSPCWRSPRGPYRLEVSVTTCAVSWPAQDGVLQDKWTPVTRRHSRLPCCAALPCNRPGQGWPCTSSMQAITPCAATF